MKIFGTKVIMAVLLMAVLPFSDLRADESVNPGLDAKVWLEKMQQAYRQSNFELFFCETDIGFK